MEIGKENSVTAFLVDERGFCPLRKIICDQLKCRKTLNIKALRRFLTKSVKKS